MGRRTLDKTAQQIKEQRKRWWGEERNARRRDRYAEDPDYAERIRDQARTAYRAKAVGDTSRDCRENLSRLDEIGKRRKIEGREALTFTTRELAVALGGYRKSVLYRWQREGQIPYPDWQVQGTTLQVYTEGEVRAMISVLGEHQEEYNYYRADQTPTIEKMQKAYNEARE